MLKFVTLFAFVALPGVAHAEQPALINMAFPPPGYTVPREDPSFPHVAPAYPDHAAECRENGSPKLILTIGADGRVSDTLIAQSTGYADIDTAAAIAARTWHYLPATKDGAPVAVRVAITIGLVPKKQSPNFATDCTYAGTQAAADALLRSAPTTTDK